MGLENESQVILKEIQEEEWNSVTLSQPKYSLQQQKASVRNKSGNLVKLRKSRKIQEFQKSNVNSSETKEEQCKSIIPSNIHNLEKGLGNLMNSDCTSQTFKGN